MAIKDMDSIIQDLGIHIAHRITMTLITIANPEETENRFEAMYEMSENKEKRAEIASIVKKGATIHTEVVLIRMENIERAYVKDYWYLR